MPGKQKLELNWIGKDELERVEPRILLNDVSKSFRAAKAVTDGDIYDNQLIFGDNLLALKALEADYAGKIKCVFIDPPYNTGSAFAQYDDGVEHSLWLKLMRDRIRLIHRLLAEDGSLWVTLDDNESHYFKVMCDEIFGRNNFVANVIWQKKYAPANDAIWLSDSHDHVLVFAKNKQVWRPELLPRSEKSNAAYKNPDNDPRGPWRADNYKCNKSATERPNLYYMIKNPNTGEEIWPQKTAVWRYSQEAHKKNVEDKLIWWGKDGTNSTPAYKRLLDSVKRDGTVPLTIWTWEEVGHTQDGKKEQLSLNPNDPFATPKPEKLMARILSIATKPGDLVLDSFAGSGTTGAVAHKMGRRWIMVEMGEHCHTHIIPRLQKVIDGTDKGGVTSDMEWTGGGGFSYSSLAPSLLEKDPHGNWVINHEYNDVMLARAMCKQMGFVFEPSNSQYFIHGHSTETDFIYVTSSSLAHTQLKSLSDEVGETKTLLVCCKAFTSDAEAFDNLTVVKIPTAVLSRCEWGREDYSLNIHPQPEEEEPDLELVTTGVS
jgi:adenine-specific DNA-methyltransferase